MGLSAVTYALCKKYTDETAVQFGGLKGANCKIKSITPSADNKYNTVVFEWKNDEGATQTSQMLVYNGNIDDVRQILDHGVKIAEIDLHDGSTVDLYAPNGGSGGSAELEEALDVTRTVGGISSGDHYDAGTSLEQIIRDMLNPTDYPTLTNPSATLSATGAKLLEKGATLSTTFTVTFSRGSINPAYGTSGYRSGVATDYALNGGTTQASNTFPVTVDETVTSYQATVNYEAGEQPKDSTGHNYSSPLPAGSVTSNTVSYEFVNAIWANTASISTITKLSLTSKSAKQRDFNFPAQTVANPEVFDIPASWTVTAVQVKNDLSGAWEDAADQFTITNTDHNDAAGTSTAYKRYTFNLGYPTGARSVRVKWS